MACGDLSIYLNRIYGILHVMKIEGKTDRVKQEKQEMLYENKFKVAIQYATEMHEGQTRKDGKTPYIIHPLSVGRVLSQAECSAETVTAGILHDVIEDTEATLEDIQNMFGTEVAGIVQDCSENKNLSWKERKQHTIETLGHVSLEACMVTVADKDNNLTSTLEEINRLGPEHVWDDFKQGRKEQEWYFRGIVNTLKERVSEMTEGQKQSFFSFEEKVEKIFR